MKTSLNVKIVREYLETLKEDGELDWLFPTLLSAMNHTIVSTPRQSKGQPQYGKDVISQGKARDGVTYRWYFQLKGGAARNITDEVFNQRDGIRESLLQAKDTIYSDSGLPEFNDLPIKLVLVHNGVLKENTRRQYDDFIKREFRPGEFERWDIEKLSKLCAENLFNEYLFCTDECTKLVRKMLVMIDVPGWDTKELEMVVDILLDRCGKRPSQRKVRQTLAALNMLQGLIRSHSPNNLLPAKKSSAVVVLKTWSWMLKHNYVGKAEYEKMYNALVWQHIYIYSEYFDKLLPLARTYKGLAMPNGLVTERVFYPMRCYDFLGDFVYYSEAMIEYAPPKKRKALICAMREEIRQLLRTNSGFDIPLRDTDSITILLTMRYMLTRVEHSAEDEKQIFDWLHKITLNLLTRYRQNKMLPEMTGNKKVIAQSLFDKSYDYADPSSLLLLILAETFAHMGDNGHYKLIRELVNESGVNLQVAYPKETEDFEVALFDHRLYRETSVEVNILLPETTAEFNEEFVKHYNHIPLQTEKSRFSFLITLAHVHYQTDMFPDEVVLGHLRPLESKESVDRTD